MNAGLSNLATLKGYVLAAALRSATDYDAALAAIGLGVAGAFEKYCNRKFARVVGATEIFGADRCQFLISRLPVESVAMMEVKQTEALGWVVQNPSPIVTLDSLAGIIYLPDRSDVGIYTTQVRFTFTGGYFWEQLEAGDGGYPTAQPNGATPIPPDLQFAWLMQCAEAWKKKDKLGQGITGGEEKTERINPANLQQKFLPEVESILAQYIRYSMT